MPAYTTVNSGASHMPTFSSTVDVEGEKFCGNAGKSKKQVELSAAKVAYITLKERKLILVIAVIGKKKKEKKKLVLFSFNATLARNRTDRFYILCIQCW